MTDRTEALDIEADGATIREALSHFDRHPFWYPKDAVALTALDRLIQALKASNEERERLRANFALMLETMGRRSHAYRQALEQVADCQEKYSAPIARAALSHPISPERSDEGTEK